MGLKNQAEVATTINPLVTFFALARIALPSILLQSGAQLATTFQTALLGHKSADLVAIWAIVATATNAATVIFNFLVVGVTAKVSKAIGARAWGQVGSRIRLAIMSALCMGIVAALFLLLLRGPIFFLLEASPEDLSLANEYFNLRVLGVPAQLLAMCTTGVLQGYKRVYMVAAIQLFRVLVDVLSSYIALYVLDLGIWGVGLGNLLAPTASTIVAFVCIWFFPPKEGRGKIRLLPKMSKDSGSLRPSTSQSAISEPLMIVESGKLSDQDGKWKTVDHETGYNALAALEDSDVELEGVNESFWKFAFDGLSTLLRSALVQTSFFAVLAYVTSLGTHSVAAHQVVMQLWMVTVYCADGFATAGTIVGSELAGQMDCADTYTERKELLEDLRTACRRVLLMGTCVGFLIASVYFVFEQDIMNLFTNDPLTQDKLKSVWLFLVLVQPLNAIVFVYDGLIYAAQAFSYMSSCLFVGFFLLFVPSLAVANLYFHTLLAAWFTKAIFNLLRLVVASYRIHWVFLSPSWLCELQ